MHLGEHPEVKPEFHQNWPPVKRAPRKEDMPPKAAECSVCRGFDHHRGRSVKFKLKHIHLWWDVLTGIRQKFHVIFQSAKKTYLNPLTQPKSHNFREKPRNVEDDPRQACEKCCLSAHPRYVFHEVLPSLPEQGYQRERDETFHASQPHHCLTIYPNGRKVSARSKSCFTSLLQRVARWSVTHQVGGRNAPRRAS